jgi:predicted NUDIX family phosphoesterase
MNEKVLVFSAKLLDELGQFSGSLKNANDVGKYLAKIFDPKNLSYMDREKAEKDPSFKQVIPYTVLTRGREVFVYQRTKKGNESRLHDLWSVGCGGHINPVDGKTDQKETYDNAFFRELYEEVGLKLFNQRRSIVAPTIGLLYDPSNEVGKVHFGIVHLVKVGFDQPLVFKDPALAEGRWKHIIDAKSEIGKYETWSQLVLKDLL